MVKVLGRSIYSKIQLKGGDKTGTMAQDLGRSILYRVNFILRLS